MPIRIEALLDKVFRTFSEKSHQVCKFTTYGWLSQLCVYEIPLASVGIKGLLSNILSTSVSTES